MLIYSQNKSSVVGHSSIAGIRWSAIQSVNGHSVLLQQELCISQLDRLEEKKKTIWIFINKAFAVPGYDAERKSMFFHQMWFYLARINSYDRISVLYLLMSSLALTFWEKLPEIGRRSSKKFYFFSFLFKLQLDI